MLSWRRSVAKNTKKHAKLIRPPETCKHARSTDAHVSSPGVLKPAWQAGRANSKSVFSIPCQKGPNTVICDFKDFTEPTAACPAW